MGLRAGREGDAVKACGQRVPAARRGRVRADDRRAILLTALLLAVAAGASYSDERRPGADPAAGAPAESSAAPSPFPDPRRLESEIRAFEEEDRLAPPPKGALLSVGSSTIRMWHATIRADLAGATVVARGFGGSTMLDLLYYANRIVVPYEPSAILLYEGDNDVAEGASPEEIRLLFDAFVEIVHASSPGTRIYVFSIKPSVARWGFWSRMREANRLVREACGEDPRLFYIDVASGMLGPDGRPRPELYLEDGLHLNREGYALWRDAARSALALD